MAEIDETVKEEKWMNHLDNDVDCFSRGIDLPQSQLCPTCTTNNYSCLKQWSTFRTRKEMRK
jgi:hypothetical protein